MAILIKDNTPYLKWMVLGQKRFVANLKKDIIVKDTDSEAVFKHNLKNGESVYYTVDKDFNIMLT